MWLKRRTINRQVWQLDELQEGKSCVCEWALFATNLFVVGVCDNVRVKTTSLQVRVQDVVFVDPKSYSTHLGGDNAKTLLKTVDQQIVMIIFLVWTRVSISRPWSGWTVILLSLAAIWWHKSKFRDNATRYYRPFKKNMVWKTTYISSKKRIGPKSKSFDHGPHGPSPCAVHVFLHWRSIHHTALQSTKLLYLEKQSMGRKEFRSIKRKQLRWMVQYLNKTMNDNWMTFNEYNNLSVPTDWSVQSSLSSWSEGSTILPSYSFYLFLFKDKSTHFNCGNW